MAGERILIIDDNPSNLKLLEFILAKAGYQVVLAENAEQALEQVGAGTPAMILLDLQLPGVDGFQLARIFRADAALDGVPIVAVTAYAMKGDEQRALDAGCDSYIAKPVDTRGLPEMIAQLLAGANAR